MESPVTVPMAMSSALHAYGVDSSLFELKHLNHLDLSGNCFNYTPIPNNLSSMLQLTYLNLSCACFAGAIPPVLGNLTKLRFLDLKSYYFYYAFDFGYSHNEKMLIDDFGWVFSLSSLEYLDLTLVKVQSNFDMVQVFNSLPNSLLTLKLRGCELQNNHHIVSPPFNSSFISKLQHLDLSNNMFDSPIPDFLRNMTSLRFLYLQENRFSSSIPLWIGKMNLVEINLGFNLFTGFEGGLSSLIRNNRNLKMFSLSNNYFLRGDVFGNHEINSSLGYSSMEKINLGGIKFGKYTIPNWLGQLKNLKFLNLSENLLYDSIPSSFGNLSSLEYMDISYNMLNGGIPTSIEKLSNLLYLKLRDNNLDGIIPEGLGQLQSLEVLYFSNNAFKGVVSEIYFVKLSRLKTIDMHGNNLLSFEMKPNWIPPFQLFYLSLGWTMGFGTTQFPRWIGTQKKLLYLNLFNTNIVEPMPTWLRFQNLLLLDLSYNQITGSLPKSINIQMPNLIYLSISNAHINSSLSQSLCKLKNLKMLLLSNNRLFGRIPSCLSTLNLNILDLSSNKFSKVIPSSFQNLSNLEILNLAKNQFEREPLAVMRNFKSLFVLDLEGNKFSGNIPTWVNCLESLQILNLRDNMFEGTIPSTLWQLPHLQILILADNKFVGNIPSNVGNFCASPIQMMDDVLVCNSMDDLFAYCNGFYIEQVVKSNNLNYSYLRLYSMVNIDLSNNNLYGQIPSEMTTVKGLFGLNLSHNCLSGTIPVEFGRSVSLESLDLSFNKLSGPIPNSMSSLSNLSVLKLSYNNLSGRIPREGQLSTLLNDPSSYEGNSYLCEEPLSVKWPDENSGNPPAEVVNDSDEEDKYEKIWLYIIVMVGYGLGFWGVVGTLILKRSWRLAYFKFMEETKD